MKKTYKFAAVAALAAMFALTIVAAGPWPLPDDDTGPDTIAAGPWPLPDDDTGPDTLV